MGNSLIRSFNNDVNLPIPSYSMNSNSISTISNTCTATISYTLHVLSDVDENGVRKMKISSTINKTLIDLIFHELEQEKVNNYHVYICSIAVKNIMNPLNVPIVVSGKIGYVVDPLMKTKSRNGDNEYNDSSVDFKYSIPENMGGSITSLSTPAVLYKHPLFVKDPTVNPLYVYAPIRKSLFNEKEETEENKKNYVKIDVKSPTYKILFSYRSYFEKLLSDTPQSKDISGDMKRTSALSKDIDSEHLVNDGNDKNEFVIIEKAAFEIFKKKTQDNILAHINHVDFDTSSIEINNDALNQKDGKRKEKLSVLKNKLMKGIMTETDTDVLYTLMSNVTFETRCYLVPKNTGVDHGLSNEKRYLNDPTSNYNNITMGSNESTAHYLHPFSDIKRMLPLSVNPMEKYVFKEKETDDIEQKTEPQKKKTTTHISEPDDGSMKIVDLDNPSTSKEELEKFEKVVRKSEIRDVLGDINKEDEE